MIRSDSPLMSADKTPWFLRLIRIAGNFISAIDWPLMVIVVVLCAVGFVAFYSASYSFPWRIDDQIRNLVFAATALLVVANVPTSWIKKLSLPVYLLGIVLLLATLIVGVNIKGATRWLDIGVRIQPSEIMKIATPLAIAWYFQLRISGAEGVLRWWDYAVAFGLLFVPVALILKQPDLGTAVLVFCAGFAVIFFAGISWKFLALIATVLMISAPIVWNSLYEYQRQRILTLLDPSSDPLGAGFHTLQAAIAIGSGGIDGKGWMNGTQAHLDFIPERTSDFLFAVYAEEFGYVGVCVLIVLYIFLISRVLYVACRANSLYERLVCFSIATIFLMYSFVNMGMVSGILPVVGVPLPFMSYGGTALLILGICCGFVMKVATGRKQTDNTDE